MFGIFLRTHEERAKLFLYVQQAYSRVPIHADLIKYQYDSERFLVVPYCQLLSGTHKVRELNAKWTSTCSRLIAMTRSTGTNSARLSKMKSQSQH